MQILLPIPNGIIFSFFWNLRKVVNYNYKKDFKKTLLLSVRSNPAVWIELEGICEILWVVRDVGEVGRPH